MSEPSPDSQKVILEQKNLRTVSMGLALPIGSVDEPIGGITSILLNHIQRNTANKNEDQFAEYVDDLGIHTYSSVGRTSMRLGLSCPPDNTEKGVQILTEMLLEPEFQENIVKQIVQRKIAQIQQMQSNPQSILSNYTRWKAAFDNDPITKHPIGTFESLQQVDLEELEAWHQNLFTTKAYFASVGIDVSINKLSNYGIDNLLDDFGNSTPVSSPITSPPGKLHKVKDMPPMPSSNAYISVNFRQKNPVETQMEDNLYNAILSGGMSSRLYTEIREKRNLSYGPYSKLSRFRDGAFISSIMDVRSERAEEALRTTLDVMHNTLHSEISNDEMNRRLKTALRVVVFVADSSSGYTNFILSRIVQGLEWEIDKIKDQLHKTAKNNWQEVLQQLWTPENLSFAVSGDAGDISDKWEKLAQEVL